MTGTPRLSQSPDALAYYAVAFNMPESVRDVSPAIVREQAAVLERVRAEEARELHHSTFVTDIMTYPLIGAAIAGALTGDIKATVLGALVGLTAAFVQARSRCGAILVRTNGQSQLRTFFGNRAVYERESSALEVSLKARGFLDDAIAPLSSKAFSGVAGTFARDTTLESLAAERRIVAALGNISRCGKPVYDVLTPLQASEAKQRGIPLFVVDANLPIRRELETHARGAVGTSWIDEHATAVDHLLIYTLQPLSSAKVDRRRFGVPPFMNGVYADGKPVAAMVTGTHVAHRKAAD